MSTAIVRQQDAAVNSFGDVQRIAEMFALSNYFDAKGTTPVAVAQIVTKIMAGRELGYGPFASVNGIHVIQGRTALGANLMAAAVKASGRYDYRVRRMDGEACEIEFFERVDGKRESLGVSSFTAADAKAAGTKNMQQFARNMLFARAMSNGVKWFTPDVFNGSTVYVPEELGAEVDGDGNVVDTTARVIVEQPQAKPANGNGSTNGHSGALWQAWVGADDAKAWAVECGAQPNEFAARNSLAKIVNDRFGGKLTTANRDDVFAAYYERQMQHLHEQANAAVEDAQEMVPA